MDPLARLDDALAKRAAADEAAALARARVLDVIRDIAPDVRQVDIVKRTGWTREYIRQITKATPD